MEVIIWNTLIVLTKACIYMGLASIAGYAFQFLPEKPEHRENYLNAISKWIAVILFVALFASGIWFLARTGAFSESGLAGAVDPLMLSILWDSPVGEVTLYRVIAIAAAIPIILLYSRYEFNTVAMRLALSVPLAVGLYSFTLAGHISEKGVYEQLVLVFHVAVAMWWIGSLLPLKLICQHNELPNTRAVMEHFGKRALYLVTALLAAGIILALQLFDKWNQVFQSAYGFVLLTKLAFVGGLLLIAARHRFFLVPDLSASGSTRKLERSILGEIVIACCLLFVTATLTSVVGPDFN